MTNVLDDDVDDDVDDVVDDDDDMPDDVINVEEAGIVVFSLLIGATAILGRVGMANNLLMLALTDGRSSWPMLDVVMADKRQEMESKQSEWTKERKNEKFNTKEK